MLFRLRSVLPELAVPDGVQALFEADASVRLATGQGVTLFHRVLEPYLQRVQAQLLGHHVHVALQGEGGVVSTGSAQGTHTHLVGEHLQPLDLQVGALVVAADDETAG